MSHGNKDIRPLHNCNRGLLDTACKMRHTRCDTHKAPTVQNSVSNMSRYRPCCPFLEHLPPRDLDVSRDLPSAKLRNYETMANGTENQDSLQPKRP